MTLTLNRITAVDSVGIKLDDVKKRKYNLWIGVSFDNKFFSANNLRRLIQFCLEHTKDKVLILFPGRMHAINYRYIEKLSRAKALHKAFKDEDNKKLEVLKIMKSFSGTKRQKVVLANYDDICTPEFIKHREILYREFSQEGLFYKNIIEITADVLGARGRTATKDRLEALALYVFQEIPLFLGGLRTISDDTVYSAIVYPGLGKLDELVDSILTAKEYKNLRDKLNLKHKAGIIDVSFQA